MEDAPLDELEDASLNICRLARCEVGGITHLKLPLGGIRYWIAVLVLFDRKRGGNVFQRTRDALGLIGRAIDGKSSSGVTRQSSERANRLRMRPLALASASMTSS